MRVAATTASAGRLRGWRLLGLVALMGAPCVIMAVNSLFAEGGRGAGFEFYGAVVAHMYAATLLPLALISLGTGVFGDEWAGGTAHYVVGVPLPRWALVVGRWLATVARALVFVLPAMVLIYLLALLPYDGAVGHYAVDLLWVLGVISLLSLAYTSLFLCLGLALKRAVMWGVVYVFAIETAVSKLPQAFASISLAFHGRNLLWRITEREAFRPITLDQFETEPPTVLGSLTWIGGFVLVTLLLATLALRRKECGGDGGGKDSSET